jgi:phage gp37-like protein
MALEKLKRVQTLERWVEVFKAAFPRASVEIHEGRVDADALQRMSVKSPAVFVAAISAQPSADAGDDTQYSDTVFSAFIVTAEQHRDIIGLNLSEAAQVVVKNTQSNIAGVARPKQVSWQNLISTVLNGRGVSLNAVAWRQLIQLGDPSTADLMYTNGLPWPGGVVPEGVYLSSESDASDGLEPIDPNPPAA